MTNDMRNEHMIKCRYAFSAAFLIAMSVIEAPCGKLQGIFDPQGRNRLF